MRPRRVLLIAGALIALLVVPMAIAAKGGTDRPFKARLTGEVTFAFPGTCQEVTTLTEATGQATHMGRIQTFWSHCPAEENNANDGRLILVGANGDEVYGEYDYDNTSPDNSFPITVVGGTGRFASASGALVVTYEVIPEFRCIPDPNSPFPCLDFSVPWQWSGTLTGRISY